MGPQETPDMDLQQLVEWYTVRIFILYLATTCLNYTCTHMFVCDMISCQLAWNSPSLACDFPLSQERPHVYYPWDTGTGDVEAVDLLAQMPQMFKNRRLKAPKRISEMSRGISDV